LTPVPDFSGDADLGLRERKKQRTRAAIVDAAVRLCMRQGYQQTTVDQIAGAAEVSPRTFSRYFPNKEAVVGALTEETSERVAVALARQPRGITEHQALVCAHVEVFAAAERGEPGAMSFDRLGGFLRIVTGSPMLSLALFTFRPDGPNRAVIQAMARRMDVPADHPAVRILFDTWAVLMAAALGDPNAAMLGPAEVSDRIQASYRIFTRLWQPWEAPGPTPPEGAR